MRYGYSIYPQSYLVAICFNLIANSVMWLSTAPISEASPSEAVQKIFRDALSADLRGNRAQCNALLAKALQLDPHFELAKWYSGQVNFLGKWQTVNEVSQYAQSDPRWAEYHLLTEDLGDTPKSHMQLATWCEHNQLEYQAKWHWLNVLASEPSDRKALGKLGLKLYEGRYLTEAQIGAAQMSERETKQNYERYTKLLESWLNEGTQLNPRAHQELRDRIASLNEEESILALVDTFFWDVKKEQRIRANLSQDAGERFLFQLRYFVIKALGNMPEYSATWALVEIALHAPDEELASLAADSLMQRRKTDYMPLLMQALTSPIEAVVTMRRSPGGQYVVHEDFYEKNPLTERQHTRTNKYLTQHYVTFTVTGPGGAGRINKIWTEEAKDYRNAMNHASNTQDQVEAENFLREASNARVLQVLKVVTGEDLGKEPTEWWNAWNHYNELNTPEELAEDRTYEINDYSQYFEDYYSQSYATPIAPPPPPRTHSCFIAGTPVWTLEGCVAIETVQVGDFVLSQDPFTGELDYCPVLETSLGKPSPILKFSIEAETLSTTRGHRFWVPMKGWEMAKHLREGDRLFTLEGVLDLHEVKDAEPQEAYNLVVGQFHTYFVGSQKILVHDKNCPLPNLAVLPGVKGELAAKSPDSTTRSQ